MERQLFFKTSHAHLNSGCPALALQVLMELPATDVSEPETNLAVLIEPNVEKSESDGMIVTGTLGDFEFGQNLNRPSDKKVNSAEGFDWSQPVSSKLANDNAEAFDWSQSVSSKLANDNAEAFDWSKPVSSKLANDNAEAFDWSKPVSSKQTNDSSEAFDWSKPVSSKLANDNAEAFDWSKSVSSNGAVGSDGVKPFSSAPSLDNGGVFENGTPTSARGKRIVFDLRCLIELLFQLGEGTHRFVACFSCGLSMGEALKYHDSLNERSGCLFKGCSRRQGSRSRWEKGA